MKPRLLCILCVLSSFNFCKAQEVTMELDTSMFDPYFQTISLPKLNGWIFRQGYDTAWSAVNIDTTGWRTVHPALLSAKDADKSGKLEGWLRLKFKLDASFESIPLGILASRWVASDIYLDGNYIRSYGSTGQMGTPYEENRNLFLDIQPLHIETGKEHVLAIHIVDYTAPFNHQFLKTESLYNNFDTFIELTGPSAYKKATAYIRDSNGSSLLFTGVLGFFTILFWFLYLQNRRY